jgi:hypothetical protein
MSNPSLDIETTLRLVRGAKSGDRKSLEDLFARYLPKVRRIVALRLGCTLRDFAAYEDMVQEGLLRAFEKLEQFQELSEGAPGCSPACSRAMVPSVPPPISGSTPPRRT